jgi:ATP-dependent DNA helicase PIF1
MEFSKEQKWAFEKYLKKENIFITGPGGTGKSALIRYIQKDAQRKGFEIQVCALTGCAAVLLECKAKTVHSWAGIGLGNGEPEQLIRKILKNKILRANWRATDILVIDEVSMMSQKLFELLDTIGKAVRRGQQPFGGIQVIFSGDFYQLPPVGSREEPETCKFCFESPLWSTTFPLKNHVQLVKIFRQNDELYQKILNQLREGKLKRSSNDILMKNVNKPFPEDMQILPTKLFPTKMKVTNINGCEMNNLHGEEYEYKLKQCTSLEMTQSEKLKRALFTKEQINVELLYLQNNLPCEEILKLKVGAQVMCIANILLSNDDVICNGARGIVVSISSDGFPMVKYNNGYKMTMTPHTWASETIPGVGVAQIPLILAWALTIHKAQGATLDIAEIDAGSGIFECGQTYVALSRVKNLEGLYLSSFDFRKVMINRKVQEFYEELKKLEQETEEHVEEHVKEHVKEVKNEKVSFEEYANNNV